MRSQSLFSTIVFIVILALGFTWAYTVYQVSSPAASTIISISSFVVAILTSMAIRIADPWDRAVILRLGQFHSLKGPGLFFIIPVLDTIPYWIDIRVITTAFKAEKTLTKDTVPVDVDAVLFWKVLDPKKAALEVAGYSVGLYDRSVLCIKFDRLSVVEVII